MEFLFSLLIFSVIPITIGLVAWLVNGNDDNKKPAQPKKKEEPKPVVPKQEETKVEREITYDDGCRLPKIERKPTYEELLNSPEWRNRRLQILKRDEYTCQRCGSKRYLQVHHRYYERYSDYTHVPVYDYPDEALVTLCNTCHKIAHKKQIKCYFRGRRVKYV